MNRNDHDLDARLRAAFTPPDDVADLARNAAAHAIAGGDPQPGAGAGTWSPWARSILAAAALFLLGFSPLWAPDLDPLPVWTEDDAADVALWGSCGDPRLDAIAEELFPLGQVACADLGHAPFEQLVPDQPMVCNVGAEDETWSALPGFPNLSWLGDPLLRLEAPRPTDDGGHRLLVERGDQRALLTIHPLAADPGFRLAADGRLRVHRKEVAGYVVHELSGSATPLFLDRIDAR